jgi:hypothetical protein
LHEPVEGDELSHELSYLPPCDTRNLVRGSDRVCNDHPGQSPRVQTFVQILSDLMRFSVEYSVEDFIFSEGVGSLRRGLKNIPVDWGPGFIHQHQSSDPPGQQIHWCIYCILVSSDMHT